MLELMDKTKILKAVETLKEYNKWRRGKTDIMPNATFTGESIDLLIELVTKEILEKR